MALARAAGAGGDAHAAAREHGERRALERSHAGTLDVQRKAYAEVPSVFRGLRLPLAELLQADQLARAAHQLGEIAGVVDLREAVAIEEPRVVRHAFPGHQVLRAH